MPTWLPPLLIAGSLTAVVDGLFSSVLSAVFYGSTVQRLFQGVAATLLGPQALTGGTRTAMIGVLMHIGVAFGWSAVFLVLFASWPWIRQATASTSGVAGVAAIYGPFVWLLMSLVVIPALTHRATPIGFRWWIQLFGHIPFVGLPIVASIRGRFPL
jgi:hypothetical protein